MKIALCLGGGGAKGSFQAGVLKYICDSGALIDGISGTSVGALNGAMVAQNRSADLLKIWTSLTRDHGFFTPWTFGRLEGFFRGGLFDPKPLRDIIDRYIDVAALIESRIKYACCSVDLITGETFTCATNRPMNRS